MYSRQQRIYLRLLHQWHFGFRAVVCRDHDERDRQRADWLAKLYFVPIGRDAIHLSRAV